MSGGEQDGFIIAIIICSIVLALLIALIVLTAVFRGCFWQKTKDSSEEDDLIPEESSDYQIAEETGQTEVSESGVLEYQSETKEGVRFEVVSEDDGGGQVDVGATEAPGEVAPDPEVKTDDVPPNPPE
jgi:hypothetical protein